MNKELTTAEINFKQYFEVFLLNIERVNHLISIYQELKPSVDSRSPPISEEDILRSAVVLNHASLDNFLRQIARHKVANSGKEYLHLIPLYKQSKAGLDKFCFLHLYEFRDKTVNQVILDSIIKHYERISFNKPYDITRTFKKEFGFNISSLEKFFPILEKMMKRRHQIVHNADNEKSQGLFTIESMDLDDVKLWFITTRDFGIALANIVVNSPIINQLAENHINRYPVE